MFPLLFWAVYFVKFLLTLTGWTFGSNFTTICVTSDILRFRIYSLWFISSIQTEQLVGLLLNSITLSVPLSGSLNPHFLSFSHGEYFYSLFHATINAELLHCLDCSVPLLLSAATQSPNMVRFSWSKRKKYLAILDNDLHLAVAKEAKPSCLFWSLWQKSNHLGLLNIPAYLQR